MHVNAMFEQNGPVGPQVGPCLRNGWERNHFTNGIQSVEEPAGTAAQSSRRAGKCAGRKFFFVRGLSSKFSAVECPEFRQR